MASISQSVIQQTPNRTEVVENLSQPKLPSPIRINQDFLVWNGPMMIPIRGRTHEQVVRETVLTWERPLYWRSLRSGPTGRKAAQKKKVW